MTNVILIIINIILSASIFLALTGCGFQPPEEQTVSKVSSEEKTDSKTKSSDEDQDEEVEEETEGVFNFETSGIAGEYKTECMRENNIYYIYEIEITKNQTLYMAAYQYETYDAGCQFSAVATTYRKYTAQFLNKSEIDLTVQDAIHTIYTESEVFYWNYRKLFGFFNWAKDVPKDIRGLRATSTSEIEPSKGDTFYLSYEFLNKKLFRISYSIQDGEKAVSPEYRSTIMDTRYFNKVK